MRDYDDLTDELLSIEWASRFESFTDRERRILGSFNEFGWQLGNRAFFRSPAQMQMAETVMLTHAGTEALELAAITLRQSWQPNDIANHERVLHILRGKVDEDEDGAHTRRLLDELDARFAATRAAKLMGLVDPVDLKQVGTPGSRMPRIVQHITADEVLDDWLHGCVVHGDPVKAAAVARWSPSAYEWSIIKAVRGITRAVLATHVVTRGALGELLEDRRVTSGPGITATSVAAVPAA
jgi:hypothetical protein